MSVQPSAFQLATLDAPGDRLPDFLIHDGSWLGDPTGLRGVVLPGEEQLLAGGLLEAGARCVYVGEAALLDSDLVARLARSHGPECVGVFVQAARMEMSWSLETQSNADFKTVTPSICEPAWEIVRRSGERTGTLLSWWLGAMFERGASSAIIQVDMIDDTDLNLCATLMDAFREKLWFAPRSRAGQNFCEWIQWGKVTQLAVPFATLDDDPNLREFSAAADKSVIS